jgi:hypothetical protein
MAFLHLAEQKKPGFFCSAIAASCGELLHANVYDFRCRIAFRAIRS